MAADLLKTKAGLLQLKAAKLKVDVCTRWNSAYEMLSRFLYLQDAIVAVIRSKDLSYLKERDVTNLNDEETAAAHELEAFLKPLKDMTTYMCHEEMPTSSVIMPLLEGLIGSKGHLRPKPDDSPFLQQMKQVMTADLEGRYAEQKEMLQTISALDPRFKSFSYMTPEQRDAIFKKLTDVTVGLHTKPMPAETVKTEPGSSGTPSLPAVEELVHDVEEIQAEQSVKVEKSEDEQRCEAKGATGERSSCLLDSLLADVYVTHVEPCKSMYQQGAEEVGKYREEQPIKMDQNPLLWWKLNEFRFPLLSRVAKMYLAVPATSVPSERVFSTAGDILTAQRANLKPQHLDKLLFLKKNLE